MITFASIEELTDALKAAEKAHGEFEKGLGYKDSAWASWYASKMALDYIAARGFNAEIVNPPNLVACHTERNPVECIRHEQQHPATVRELVFGEPVDGREVIGRAMSGEYVPTPRGFLSEKL